MLETQVWAENHHPICSVNLLSPLNSTAWTLFAAHKDPTGGERKLWGEPSRALCEGSECVEVERALNYDWATAKRVEEEGRKNACLCTGTT